MRILLLGQHGQLSRELQLSLHGAGQLLVAGRDRLDLAEPAQIRRQLRALRPELIVNAAAYTAVDQAEHEPQPAFALNATAPGILAEEAAALAVPLIHYSSDYVFDGRQSTPYDEDDAPNPLNVYGQSKLAGERAIQAVGGAHLILRSSWIYSLHGRNFLLSMQRLLRERDELKVVDDQIGAPTWAGSLASATGELIERWRSGRAGPWGLYHLCAQGETSWFGFASAIAEHLRAHGPVRRPPAADPQQRLSDPGPAPAQLAPGLFAPATRLAGPAAGLARRPARLPAQPTLRAPGCIMRPIA